MAKVKINQGILVGGKCKTERGFEYYEFLQIPYAEPPLGALRFKSPQPPKSWDGERNATEVNRNNLAAQINILGEYEGSEDCLYLNVYTPKLDSKSKLLPVMVYLHGGGFELGNGTFKDQLGAGFIVEQDVVCVCINYRLGVFGFLCLDIPEAAGNMGLKDQVASLKWVQENIAAFGGDRTNVTFAGFSAGSASVEYHILSQASKGLFSKGILHSGSALNHWAHDYNKKEHGLKLAQNLGYQGSSIDMNAVFEYLMRQTTKTMIDKTRDLQKEYEGKAVYIIFVPTVEKDFGNGEAFLTELPYKLLKEGRFNKVPIIRGFTEFEGSFSQVCKPHIINMLTEDNNFANFWKFPLDPDDIEKYNREFKREYFNEKVYKNDPKWGSVDFFSDYDFVSGIITSTKFMVRQGIPVYTYIYAFDGTISIFKFLRNIDRKGPGHCDDLPYFIDFKLPGFNFKLTDADILVKKRATKMCANFAKTGHPTPDSTDVDLPLQWPAFTLDEQKYMVIDENMRIKIGYQDGKISIFEEIYEKYRK